MVFEVYGSVFRLDERYELVKPLGKGAYGVVCSAMDTLRQSKVAIKKISPMSKTEYDAKHVLREIRLLRYLGLHPNIITLENLFLFQSHDEIYVVMECMDTDLHRIIQSPQKLSLQHLRHFLYQLLRGVQFLHKQGVLHRDLKPANLLVSKTCELRISDFGLARVKNYRDHPLSATKSVRGRGDTVQNVEMAPMTEHVVTRWYRAPELMLNPDGLYDSYVDIWSIGCIFAELLKRNPVFQGKNFMEQLNLIFDVIGTPSIEEMSYVQNSQALKYLASLDIKRAKNLFEVLSSEKSGENLTNESIDFVQQCLRFDLKSRINVEQALKHDFFKNTAYENMSEVNVNLTVDLFDAFEFERTSHLSQKENHEALKNMICEEVASFQFQQSFQNGINSNNSTLFSDSIENETEFENYKKLNYRLSQASNIPSYSKQNGNGNDNHISYLSSTSTQMFSKSQSKNSKRTTRSFLPTRKVSHCTFPINYNGSRADNKKPDENNKTDAALRQKIANSKNRHASFCNMNDLTTKAATISKDKYESEAKVGTSSYYLRNNSNSRIVTPTNFHKRMSQPGVNFRQQSYDSEISDNSENEATDLESEKKHTETDVSFLGLSKISRISKIAKCRSEPKKKSKVCYIEQAMDKMRMNSNLNLRNNPNRSEQHGDPTLLPSENLESDNEITQSEIEQLKAKLNFDFEATGVSTSRSKKVSLEKIFNGQRQFV